MTHRSEKPSDQFASRKSFFKLSLVTLTALTVGSCTIDSQSASENETLKAWKDVAASSPTAVPAAPRLPPMPVFADERANALEASLPEALPQIPVKNMVLTREMDVGVLLRALADAADLNIIVSNNVSGSIRVNLRRETRWDRLFLAITEGNGLHYELREDLLRIYSVQDIQNKVAMEEALQNQLDAAEKRMRSEPMIMRMVRIRYADLESLTNSVRETMQAIVTADSESDETAGDSILPGNQRTNFMVKADTDSGQLIMHGIPSDIAQAEQLIHQLDRPTHQILIEATIVQANDEVARQLGMQWGVFDGGNGGSAIGITPQEGGFNSNFPAGFDPLGSGFIFGASRVRGSQVLQAQLSALQREGRLNIISRPSITTLDQRTATIESGEERPFATAAGAGIAAVAQVQFKKATLRLEVTPHVIDQNWVKLDLNTTKDDFDDTRSIIIDGNVQVPILTRSAITSLYLANGQTTVIGGLSAETETRQKEGVPVLKNIPGLGAMFRNSSDRNGFNDTLIFITPHVLPQNGITVERRGK